MANTCPYNMLGAEIYTNISIYVHHLKTKSIARRSEKEKYYTFYIFIFLATLVHYHNFLPNFAHFVLFIFLYPLIN